MMESLSHNCVLLEKRRVQSPEGGWTTTWKDGAAFKTYPALDSSMQARVAEKQGVTSVYNVLVPQELPVEVGDYYRDETLGATFHVTSRPEEKQTPQTSQLNLKGFTAERSALPG